MFIRLLDFARTAVLFLMLDAVTSTVAIPCLGFAAIASVVKLVAFAIGFDGISWWWVLFPLACYGAWVSAMCIALFSIVVIAVDEDLEDFSPVKENTGRPDRPSCCASCRDKHRTSLGDAGKQGH